MVINTITNETFSDVTGLLPGTTYELTVVAVSQGGSVIAESQASSPILNTTGVTGRSIVIHIILTILIYCIIYSSCPHMQCFNEWCCHGNLVLRPHWRPSSDQCVPVLYI